MAKLAVLKNRGSHWQTWDNTKAVDPWEIGKGESKYEDGKVSLHSTSFKPFESLLDSMDGEKAHFPSAIRTQDPHESFNITLLHVS